MFRRFFLASIKKSRENRKLFSNAFYLFVLQCVNYILPLITIPYLIRVLGTETFGILAFFGAFITYFQLIIDYGFNLSATRIVSMNRKDPHELSHLFFTVVTIKIFLTLACLIILLFFFIIPRFHTEEQLCLLLFLGVAGTILFPTWFYQGMEDMRYITIFNIISKLVVSFLYFIVIKNPHDYLRFAFLNTLGTWIIGLVAFFFALRKYSLTPILPRRSACFTMLKEGFNIFVSQISVSLFTNTNTFLLGLFTNNQVVGKYAIAEKIVRAAITPVGPISNALFPRTAVLFHESRERAIRFLQKVQLFGSAVFGLFSIGLFVFADFLVHVVSGSESTEIAFLLRIMSVLPLSVFLDNIYGTQIMLNVNLQKQFMRIVLLCGVVSVILLVVLIPPLKGIGSAISFLSSELLALSLFFVTVRKAGILLFKKA